MEEIRRSGTWGSALTSDEFAAIRSVGFEPVGQVLGAAVYNVGYTGGFNCPGAWGSGQWGMPARTQTQVSSRGGYGSFAPLVRTMYEARHKAIDRMTTECAELGGHGVVGVLLTIGAFPAGGLEFKAIGTAIRAPDVPPVSYWHGGPRGPGTRQPFTSDLSGQDFAKLIMKGWVPAGLALGISIGSRHDDWLTVGQTRWGSGNAEVVGYTELVNDARHDSRVQLEKDVRRLGGEGVVIADIDMRVRERECPAMEGRRDHIVEATCIGTAIARFSSASLQSGSGKKTLAVMSLDPQRRQAARIRI
jgi:uncharacterized protein YbjQ (UPF0145 family)